MLNYLSRLKTGYILLMLQLSLCSFSFAFIPLFFKTQGYSLPYLVLIYVLYTGLAALLIPFIRTFYLRKFMILGCLIFMVAALLLIFAPSPYAPILYGALISLTIILFWIPLNYLFFNTSTTGTNAVDSSLYMNSSALFSILIPPLSALIIHQLGYDWLFGITLFLYLLPLLFILKNIPEQRTETRFLESVKKFKRLKMITLCDGALGYFSGIVIPIYALLFLKTETEFGLFLSLFSLGGFLVALFFSYRSDKNQQRKKYIFTVFFLLTASILLLALVKTTPQWILAIGIFSVFISISLPLRLATALDVKMADFGFWKVREFFLNLGRVVTLVISMILFYSELYWGVFAMFGLIAMTYPFLVWYKLKELK